MGTRTGDLDPGVVLFLARAGKLDSASSGLSDIDALESLLNHESGLAGLSGGISDMRELTAAAARSSDQGSATADQASATANQAIAIFCRSIAKTIAGYAAVLGGLDALVFTGGIGEHSVPVREKVCRQLAFLGITLDAEANQRHAAIISRQTGPLPGPIPGPITVRILPADEDGRIAHHVSNLLAQ
jgi:acetate kinase